MIERLKQVREKANPRANPFISDRRADMMKTSLSSMTNLNLEQEMTFRCKLGVELVQAGRSEDALREYQTETSVSPHF